MDSKMIKTFATPAGMIGYSSSGNLRVSDVPQRFVQDGYRPLWSAVIHIGDPSTVRQCYERARSGCPLMPDEGVGMNDAGFLFTNDSVTAFLDTSEESYSEIMTFEEFSPILEAWEKAWAALQAYKAQAGTE